MLHLSIPGCSAGRESARDALPVHQKRIRPGYASNHVIEFFRRSDDAPIGRIHSDYPVGIAAERINVQRYVVVELPVACAKNSSLVRERRPGEPGPRRDSQAGCQPLMLYTQPRIYRELRSGSPVILRITGELKV